MESVRFMAEPENSEHSGRDCDTIKISPRSCSSSDLRRDGDNCGDKTTTKWDRTALVRQLLAALGAVIGSITFGMTTAFSATLSRRNLAAVDRADAHATLADKAFESRIASSVVLWMLVGVVTGSVCMRLYGRRMVQVGMYVSWTCGWSTIWWYWYRRRCCADAGTGTGTDVDVDVDAQVWSLVCGCALIGLSAGSHSVVTSVYVGEIAEARFRGLIAVQISLGVAVGILSSHAQGVFFEPTTALRTNAVLSAAALAAVLTFACESPTWLLLNGRVQTASSVLLRLRNESPTSQRELDSLANAVADYDRRAGYSIRNITREISSKAFRKSFFVLNVLFVVQQGSGLNVIVFYAVTLLEAAAADGDAHDAGLGSLDASSSVIVVDTVRLLATLVACALVKLTSRRKLYFWSAGAALVSICAVVLCKSVYRAADVYVVFFIGAYIAFLYVGVSPIPWIMVGELYPANLKEFGICASNFVCFLVMLIVVKTAVFLLTSCGMAITFSIYLFVVLAGIVYLFFCMPETNNITLQQIEKNLNS